MRLVRVPLEAYVEVMYTLDDPPYEMEKGKHYPITIRDVELRGESIKRLLHVSHIMLLQRRVWLNLVDGD